MLFTLVAHHRSLFTGRSSQVSWNALHRSLFTSLGTLFSGRRQVWRSANRRLRPFGRPSQCHHPLTLRASIRLRSKRHARPVIKEEVIRDHQRSSGFIRGHQTRQTCDQGEVIRVHQRSSAFISVHQRSSEVIRGYQRSSKVIRGHQRSSEVIRSHRSQSELIRAHQSSSELIRAHQRSKRHA